MASLTAGEIIWKINGDSSGFDRSIQKAEKSTKSFSGFLGKAALGVAALGAGFIAVAKNALGNAAALEQNQIALTTMLKSADKANDALQRFRDFGASTPFETTEIIKSGKQMIAFGFSVDKTMENLKMLGDVAAGIGVPLNQLSEIYSKIKVGQTAYNEDLNQLAGRGIPIFDELAKVTGRNATEIKKLSSEGKITFTEIEKAFQNMTNTGGTFAGLMKAQSQSLGGLWSTLKSQVTEASTQIGVEMSSSMKVMIRSFSIGMEAGGSFNAFFGILAKGAVGTAKIITKSFIGLSFVLNKVRKKISDITLNNLKEQRDTILANHKLTLKSPISELKRAGIYEKIKNLQNRINTELQRGNDIRDNTNKLEEELVELEKDREKNQEKIKQNIKKINDLNKKLATITNNGTKAIKKQKTALEQTLDVMEKIGNSTSSVMSQISNIFSGISNIMEAQTEKQLEVLDSQMNAEINAAGVAEETTKQKLERELKAAIAAGDTETANKKKNEIERTKIEEKYAKKRADIEYKLALMQWQFKLAMAIAQLPLLILQGITAGMSVGGPYAPIFAAAYGALAAASGGIQVAAVAAAKPTQPSFQTGGIVSGNQFSGDSVPARVNSGEMILNGAQQKQLFNQANGINSGGSNGLTRVSITEESTWTEIYKASKNGNLFIDKRAVISK